MFVIKILKTHLEHRDVTESNKQIYFVQLQEVFSMKSTNICRI